MKSRITWLVKGDKNTAFYHTSTLVRRNRNRISCLKDHLGNWMNEVGKIANFIRNGYSELFTVTAPLLSYLRTPLVGILA